MEKSKSNTSKPNFMRKIASSLGINNQHIQNINPSPPINLTSPVSHIELAAKDNGPIDNESTVSNDSIDNSRRKSSSYTQRSRGLSDASSVTANPKPRREPKQFNDFLQRQSIAFSSSSIIERSYLDNRNNDSASIMTRPSNPQSRVTSGVAKSIADSALEETILLTLTAPHKDFSKSRQQSFALTNQQLRSSSIQEEPEEDTNHIEISSSTKQRSYLYKKYMERRIKNIEDMQTKLKEYNPLQVLRYRLLNVDDNSTEMQSWKNSYIWGVSNQESEKYIKNYESNVQYTQNDVLKNTPSKVQESSSTQDDFVSREAILESQRKIMPSKLSDFGDSLFAKNNGPSIINSTKRNLENGSSPKPLLESEHKLSIDNSSYGKLEHANSIPHASTKFISTFPETSNRNLHESEISIKQLNSTESARNEKPLKHQPELIVPIDNPTNNRTSITANPLRVSVGESMKPKKWFGKERSPTKPGISQHWTSIFKSIDSLSTFRHSKNEIGTPIVRSIDELNRETHPSSSATDVRGSSIDKERKFMKQNSSPHLKLAIPNTEGVGGRQIKEKSASPLKKEIQEDCTSHIGNETDASDSKSLLPSTISPVKSLAHLHNSNSVNIVGSTGKEEENTLIDFIEQQVLEMTPIVEEIVSRFQIIMAKSSRVEVDIQKLFIDRSLEFKKDKVNYSNQTIDSTYNSLLTKNTDIRKRMKELDAHIESSQKELLFDLDHQLKNAEDLLQDTSSQGTSWTLEFYYAFMALALRWLGYSIWLFFKVYKAGKYLISAVKSKAIEPENNGELAESPSTRERLLMFARKPSLGSLDAKQNSNKMSELEKAMKAATLEGSEEEIHSDEAEERHFDISVVQKPFEDPREQEESDAEMFRGVLLFLDNKFEEAERLFATKADRDPIYALGEGALLFIKALMTFGEDDIKKAIAQLERTEALANAQAAFYSDPVTLASAAKSVVSLPFTAIGSLLRFSGMTEAAEEPPMPNGLLRALVCKAEANLLSALLQLFHESIVGFVKAGFKMRKGHKSYSIAWKEYQKLSPEDLKKYDKHTITGIEFGQGTLNVSIAHLPTKILNFVSFLGFKGENELGFHLLQKSFDGNGIRSGMASLVILIMYQLKLSFAPHIYGDELIAKCDVLMAQCLARYSTSALHLFMAARLERARRNIDVSLAYFKKCSEAQDDWKELNYLCSYEMGMNQSFQLEWEKAAALMEKLYEASYWSKGFYAYFYAACLDMLATTDTKGTDADRKVWKDKAVDLYGKIPAFVARKFGGRVLSVETYVLRKIKTFQRDNYEYTLLPILELIGLWNGFKFMPKEKLQVVKSLVIKTLKDVELCGQLNSEKCWNEQQVIERSASLHMTLGSILRELGDYDGAANEFKWIFDREKEIKEEKLVVPFSHYEQGILYFLQGKDKETRKSFKIAKNNYSDYNFEFRLDFRIHMALLEMDKKEVE